jgi:RNA polymerase sigma factor (sigma-70 family)
MASQQSTVVLRFIRRIASERALGTLPDRELLERFLGRQDEAAFAALVQRHGPLVMGVCRRVLGHVQDAEDAFQATFLVLVRKAGSITRRESVGSWLHGVAMRIAHKTRSQNARRHARETNLPTHEVPDRPGVAQDGGFGALLDEEVNRLPDRYRLPVLLCYLEGKTTAEAAQHLGCPRGTVLSRLARARACLRRRLTCRGWILSAAVSSMVLHQAMSARAVPLALAASTVKAALSVAAGGLPAESTTIALAKGAIQAMFVTKLRQVMLVILLAAGVLGSSAGLLTQQLTAAKTNDEPGTHLIPGEPNAIRLSGKAVAQFDIQTGQIRRRGAAQTRQIRLTGTTALDPQRLWRIRCSVPGTVIELPRIVQPGSTIQQGDVLAVIHSSALAETKSELVDALVQKRLDEQILKRTQNAAAAVPEVFLLNARRTVVSDASVIRRLENTLHRYGLSEDELKGLQEYAAGLDLDNNKRDREKEKPWARLELHASQGGVLVERNVGLGEVLTDQSVTLFTLADVRQLKVLANANQSDLPLLEALPPTHRRWVIRAPGLPLAEGQIEKVSSLIDPNQHTVVVSGNVANPDRYLRGGQVVMVTIALPAPRDELAIPSSALVDVHGETVIFIQPAPARPVYVQRRVGVIRRSRDIAHVRLVLKPGEHIVTNGALDLQAALDDLKAEHK